MSTESIHFADGVEFVPLGELGNGDDGVAVDWARAKARWQALPEGWLSATAMRDALMRVARIPDYDLAAGEGLLLGMNDFLEARASGSGRTREYRRREVLPEPMSPAAQIEAETARLAEVERERFERELHAREAKHVEENQVFLDNNRRLHRELSDEYTVPLIRGLEARIAQLEEQLAQHGEPVAVDATSTPAPALAPGPSEAPAESRLAQVRRFLFGDADEDEIRDLLDQAENDD